MRTAKPQNAQLPEHFRGIVEPLCTRLHDALGDGLVSLVLYGASVRDPGSSTAAPGSLMIVVRDASTDTLGRLAATLDVRNLDGRLSAMVVTELDIERSTDVFPVKFLDMQHHHVVLHGESVLDQVVINPDNLRLRCEQETRNTLLRLRSLYLQRANDAQQLHKTLLTALTSFLTTVNAFLSLVDGQVRRSDAEIASAARKGLRLESDVLERLIAMRQTQSLPDGEQVKAAFDDFMAAVQRTAEVIDRFEPRPCAG